MPLSEEYLAGLFDGEGHVTVTRNRANAREYLTVGCGISNQNRSVLETIREQYGGGIYCGNHATETRKATYAWLARSVEMTQFLQAVLPYLQIKRRQAELGIEFQIGMSFTRQHGAWAANGNSEERCGRVTVEEAARRERIRVELRSLNAKCRFV